MFSTICGTGRFSTNAVKIGASAIGRPKRAAMNSPSCHVTRISRMLRSSIDIF
jgi:hypothetical protein